MLNDVHQAEGDIIDAATVCVVAADVISAQQKQAILGKLARFRDERGCAHLVCSACEHRAGCERRVFDIMGQH
ncbi:MAG TPA: hypothetical protein VD995_01840 [Azospirillum sp.]|nr:hypothetical protein [Azospirillum sp.]